jgi:hypothetical protein
MKKVYTSLKFKYQGIKKIVLVMSMTFAVTSIVLGQTYSQTLLPKKAKWSTIEYKSSNNSNYIAIGYVYKKKFVDGQNVTFLSLPARDTIISGKYFTKTENDAYIEGIWKRNTDNGITRADGLFKVSNLKTGTGLTINPKKGDALLIETENIYSYYGFRNKYPAVLQKLPDNNYSLKIEYTDRYKEDDVVKLELIVDKSLVYKYGFYSIDDFIYYVENVTKTYKDGTVFIGKVENTKAENNTVNSKLKEGKFIYASGEIASRELIIQFPPDGTFLLRIEYSKEKDPFAKMELIVSKNLIDKYDYWNTSEHIYNTSKIKMTYKNGDVFTGITKNTKDSSGNFNQLFTVGEYKYGTGEIFQGDLSGQWYCGVPISGEMKFINGNIEKGNWLQKYNLTQQEYNKVLEGKSPTEKRTIAQALYKDKQYQAAIDEAESALQYNDYSGAKDAYSRALEIKPEKAKYMDSQIERVEKLRKEQQQIEKLRREQERKQAYISKYGERYGTLISQGKLEVGMSKAMVNEVWDENYFIISKSALSGNSIEIWQFSKDKMQTTLMLEGAKHNESGGKGGEAALAAIFLMNLFGQMGGPTVPQMLIFTNNKLTDIYR